MRDSVARVVRVELGEIFDAHEDRVHTMLVRRKVARRIEQRLRDLIVGRGNESTGPNSAVVPKM